ncbi:MAG TPA: type II toxin-antitoxin system VapC family toxin [Thermoanaerobaculia bacterium]|nr:type II toxin-antitoxin system VapC family toxin [Thermoanaerobaculia bacterium]
MKVIDSSGWLEFFADGPLAEQYASHLVDFSQILTPVIVLYEVYKRIKRERSEEDALVAAAQLRRTRIVPVTETAAMKAADLSLDHQLAMADAIVYATAILHDATVVTSDSDFESLPGVIYYPKASKA